MKSIAKGVCMCVCVGAPLHNPSGKKCMAAQMNMEQLAWYAWNTMRT